MSAVPDGGAHDSGGIGILSHVLSSRELVRLLTSPETDAEFFAVLLPLLLERDPLERLIANGPTERVEQVQSVFATSSARTSPAGRHLLPAALRIRRLGYERAYLQPTVDKYVSEAELSDEALAQVEAWAGNDAARIGVAVRLLEMRLLLRTKRGGDPELDRFVPLLLRLLSKTPAGLSETDLDRLLWTVYPHLDRRLLELALASPERAWRFPSLVRYARLRGIVQDDWIDRFLVLGDRRVDAGLIENPALPEPALRRLFERYYPSQPCLAGRLLASREWAVQRLLARGDADAVVGLADSRAWVSAAWRAEVARVRLALAVSGSKPFVHACQAAAVHEARGADHGGWRHEPPLPQPS